MFCTLPARVAPDLKRLLVIYLPNLRILSTSTFAYTARMESSA